MVRGRPPPAVAISACAPPVLLSRLWRSRQRRGRAFDHMRDLISVLYSVEPRVLQDPHFLDRSLLLDGVPVYVSPGELIRSISGVQTAVLVRDSDTGSRIGLVIFSDALESASVLIQTPPRWLYATCTSAKGRGEEVSRTCILDGIGDALARRAMGNVFRSLVPPQFLLADEDREFHLRCVLVGAGRATISDGAHGLSELGWKVLFVPGYVVAAIVSPDRQAGMLVYDDTQCSELVARRAPQLQYQMGLQLYDSSLFPSSADPTDRASTLLRRLLPRYVTDDEESYMGRVLLFTGLELGSQQLDAAHFAHFLHFEADLIHAVEAVIIHRSERLVVVVLGSSDDAASLLQMPKETWFRFFGRTTGCSSIFGFQGPSAAPDIGSDQPSPSGTIGAVYCSTQALRSVEDWIKAKMRRLKDDDIVGFVDCLIRRCALLAANSVMRSDFAERGLLLSGVAQGLTRSDLQSRLVPAFGHLDATAVENESKMALAMVVFRYWHAAARLLREPVETWARLGFQACTPVPGAEHAGDIAQEVETQLFMEEIVDWVLR